MILLASNQRGSRRKKEGRVSSSKIRAHDDHDESPHPNAEPMERSEACGFRFAESPQVIPTLLAHTRNSKFCVESTKVCGLGEMIHRMFRTHLHSPQREQYYHQTIVTY